MSGFPTLTSASSRLNSELNGARQRLLMIEDEKRSQQISLDKISAETARVSRKLAETEASLTATHGRLRHVEGNFAELSTERARLADAIEEINERHDHELTTQRMRFDALQARAAASEKLSAKRASICWRVPTRSASMTGARANLRRSATPCRRGCRNSRRRESARIQFTEVDQARATLMERSARSPVPLPRKMPRCSARKIRSRR